MARILETTIRDGSYEVGFQFTLRDVAVLAGLLDQAGFSFIEVGHGNGLGGEVFGDHAAATDEEYLEVARRSVRRAKLGALLGFTKRSPESILGRVRAAADAGLDFLRMGFVPRRSDDEIIVESIRLAKKLGLTVSVNFMRTYCETPAQIAERCRRALDLGVDWIYAVDSAGGMTRDQVMRYIEAIRDAGPSEVGFHAHNNTQMAAANCLAAMEAGATLLDTSLQGLGRATGNAQTEVILSILQLRHDMEAEIDREMVYRLGRRFTQPLIQPGFDPTHVLSGVLNVHSSSLPQLSRVARENQLDVDQLLAVAGRRAAEANKLDTRDLPADIVRDACQAVSAAPRGHAYELEGLNELEAELDSPSAEDLADVFAQLKALALRDHLSAAVVLVPRDDWWFSGCGTVRRGTWALAVVPIDSLAGVDLAPHLDAPWLRRVFAADHLVDGADVPGSVPVTRFSLRDLVAEAATSIDDVRVPTLVAIEHDAVRRAVVGRLGSCAQLAVIEPGAELAIPSDCEHVLVEGRFAALCTDPVHSGNLDGRTVTVLGKRPPKLAALRDAGARIRVPDIFPLLVARVSVHDQVNVCDGGRNELIAGLQSAATDSLVAFGDRVLDPNDDTRLGTWSSVDAEGSGDAPRRSSEVAVSRSAVRLSRLVK